MTKPLNKGTLVKPKSGKHAGKVGTVEHSDKSITTVNFNGVIDPVWTNLLAIVEVTDRDFDQLTDKVIEEFLKPTEPPPAKTNFDQSAQNSVSEWWDTFVGRKNRRKFAARRGFTPFEVDGLAATDWTDIPPEWKHRLLTH